MSGPTSFEQLVNQALVRIGYPEYIGNIYDGTKQAAAALIAYGQTRDQFLRTDDFDFAERNLTLTLLKQAPDGGYIPPNVWGPQYPALPWLFEYAYPIDCLKVRSVRQQAIFVMNFDPQPNVFSITNDDSYSPAKKVILCNVPSAILTYTAQIVDLTTWEPDAIEAFVAALAQRLSVALDRTTALKLAVQEEQALTAIAEKEQG